MNRDSKQDGQALAQVALLLVVLLAFLALATDVGMVYLKRRQLQNAADAGALEGARYICFEENNVAAARSRATTVALAQFSDSSGVDVDFPATGSPYTTTVVVRETIPSFAANIVGVNDFAVGADATAICGAADRGVGGIWPVTMNVADWNTVSCGSAFTVWKADNDTTFCNQCNCNKVIPDGNNSNQLCIPDPAVLTNLMTVGAPLTIGPGQSGWLNLFDPQPPLPIPTCNYENCGANGVACYMAQPHPGPISVCDQLGNKSATVQFNRNIKDAVCEHAAQKTHLSIPLWSNDYQDICPELHPLIGNCGTASPYPIVDFGCIEVLGYSTEAYVPYLNPATPGKCEDHLTVIFARKLCDGCNSYQGGTGSGGPPNGVGAVSLVK